MEALADALQHNTTLAYLNLGDNQIGDKGEEAQGFAFLIGGIFHPQIPADFSRNLLHGGFGRRLAAQPDPNLSQPQLESEWW